MVIPSFETYSTPHLARIALLALSLTLGVAAFPTTSAQAEACPGSGQATACPYASATIIGQRAESVLRFPEAVVVDSAGDVYVADQLSYVVQKFSAAGAFLGEWGTYGGGHGQFGPIGGLATDTAGDVYVVDSAHDRIEKFSSEGEFLTAWGHKGSELGDFEFGSSQNYTKPPGGGIAVAGEYVYVADSGNNRIERFNLSGGEPIEWGSQGSEGGQFSYPRGVAANATEVLVADDDNHRIEKFSPSGTYESSVGSEGTGPGHFGFPYGITLDAAGNVYVADDINHRIVKLDPQLGPAGEWGGFGSAPGQLAFPRALASDPAGDTYVADTANDRIEVFSSSGSYLRTIGVSARADPGAFVAPRGVAVDPTGRLYVSDTDDNRILSFAQGGGAFLGAWTSTGGNKTGYSEPEGIAFAPQGSVYIADTGDARVTRLWGEGTYLSELGGPADLGGAGLSGAGSVAVSVASGGVYVADTNHNRILVYSPAGALLVKVGANEADGSAGSGPGAFNHPAAVAVAPSGNVFVADTANNRIVELTPDGTFARAFGQLGAGDGHLHNPTGVAVDAAGRVYVVDATNNRVEVFDESGHYLAKWGLRGASLGEALAADRDRRRLRRQRVCGGYEQQPRRALRPRLARRGELSGPGRVAAAAGRGASGACQPAAQLGRAEETRARAVGELRTRLSHPRHRNAPDALLAPCNRAGRGRPAPTARARRARAPAPAPLLAESSAPCAGTPHHDGGNCAHRRRGSHRAAHGRYQNLHRGAIMFA